MHKIPSKTMFHYPYTNHCSLPKNFKLPKKQNQLITNLLGTYQSTGYPLYNCNLPGVLTKTRLDAHLLYYPTNVLLQLLSHDFLSDYYTNEVLQPPCRESCPMLEAKTAKSTFSLPNFQNLKNNIL